MAKYNKPIYRRYRIIAIAAFVGADFDDMDAAMKYFNSINPNEKCYRGNDFIKNGNYAVLIDTEEARQIAANHRDISNQ